MPRSTRPLAMLVAGFLLAACGTPEPTPSVAGSAATTPSPPASAAPAAPSTAATGTSAPAETSPGVAEDPPPIAIEPVVGGLADPISIASSPDGWLLVNERGGRVIAVDPASGDTEVALDLTDRVLGQSEQGLLGLALHPDWPDDDRTFVHYSDRNGGTVLAEFRAAATEPFPRIDAGSERILLRADQPYGNHNGGQLAFGPDGYLWLGLGDGGSGGDPEGNGQDPETLLGSILRLDVSEPGSYSVPGDNPFVDGGGAPEVYLIGLRNPWRFSFDRVSGELWIADVGQSAFEEINRLDPATSAGANLGWAVMEGSHCFADAGCTSDGLVTPLAEYGREGGCSVTGGYVYRGSTMPGLAGWYLFSDYCSGTLFGLPSDAEQPTDGTALAPRALLATGARVSSFGEGAGGELYLADLGSGTLYRVVPGG